MPTIAEYVVVPRAGTAGPAGPPGPPGEAGAAGAQGTIGLTGNTGLTGSAGDPGTQGIQGVIGLTGPAGPADRASHTGTQTASTISDFAAAADTRTAAAVGVTVQAHSANLAEYAAVNPTAAGLAVLDDATTADQRTTLGLGTAATAATGDFAAAAHTQAISTVTGLQAGLDAKLDDSQASAAGLSMLGAADVAAQTALLAAFTSALKGLVPASGGGTANFLRADGQFVAPTAGASTISTTEQAPASSQTIATGLSAYVARSYEITGALSLTLNGSAAFEIG